MTLDKNILLELQEKHVLENIDLFFADFCSFFCDCVELVHVHLETVVYVDNRATHFFFG